MRMLSLRLVLAGLVALVVAGCATAYEWGAMEDPDWAPRIGVATFTQVTREIGQPVEKLNLPSGDLKARWYGRPITVSDSQGTMQDYSVQRTQDRAYWRDMKFDKTGKLIRAWMSDQRRLEDSESP
jgi:hypothetical protein